MKLNKQYIRYPNGNSEQKLSKRFGLYWDSKIQDWELIVSDYRRIDEFLNVYINELDNYDDKFTLMCLIVSSFDDIASNFSNETQNHWNICSLILEKECFLHYSTIEYWCLLKNEPDNLFSISLFMREIWKKVKFNFI